MKPLSWTEEKQNSFFVTLFSFSILNWEQLKETQITTKKKRVAEAYEKDWQQK